MAVRTRFEIKLNPNFLREATARGVALLDPITQQITSFIAKRSPVDTGTNRRSIMFSWVSEFIRQINSDTGYGGWLTIGHRSKSGKMIAARPYFQQGLADAITAISKVKNASQLDSPLPDNGRPM